MNDQTRAQSIAEACEPAVNAYLMAKAYAQLKREEVDGVKLELLMESVYMVTPENERRGRKDERIIEPRYDWLMSDEDSKDYHANVNHIERERGIKPAEMPDEHCPALCAEHVQMQAETLLIETAWPMAADDDCGRNLLYGEKRARFIELIVKLVINREGYKNPLTGKELA
jgi:hypothetical protein